MKQRLREEVESPFRKVRLAFFGSSAASAAIALYFSLLTALKASMGGFADVPPLDEALQSVGINVAGVVVCGALVYRDVQAGKANLARIAKGGALARLVVSPAASPKERATLKDYRRSSRVLLCAGGKEYINELARSLNSDQLSDSNTIPEALRDVDVLVVPILLKEDDAVGDTRTAWVETEAQEGDRNLILPDPTMLSHSLKEWAPGQIISRTNWRLLEDRALMFWARVLPLPSRRMVVSCAEPLDSHNGVGLSEPWRSWMEASSECLEMMSDMVAISSINMMLDFIMTPYVSLALTVLCVAPKCSSTELREHS